MPKRRLSRSKPSNRPPGYYENPAIPVAVDSKILVYSSVTERFVPAVVTKIMKARYIIKYEGGGSDCLVLDNQAWMYPPGLKREVVMKHVRSVLSYKYYKNASGQPVSQTSQVIIPDRRSSVEPITVETSATTSQRSASSKGDQNRKKARVEVRHYLGSTCEVGSMVLTDTSDA